MAAKDSTGSGSGDRAELDSLFERLDESGARSAGASEGPGDQELLRIGRRFQLDPLRLLVTLTLFLTVMSGYFMWQTRYEVGYWLSSGDTPVEVGDLRDRYRAGQTELDTTSNRYAHVHGLLTTFEHVPTEDESQPRQAPRPGGEPWFFVCPLYDIVVRTTQPPLDKPFSIHIEVDAAFLPLIEARRAYPADLVVAMEATGRLVRAEELPWWHQRNVRRVAVAAHRDPRAVWVLLDGDRPEAYRAFGLLWLGAPLAPLLSLLLLWRSWRRRRRLG